MAIGGGAMRRVGKILENMTEIAHIRLPKRFIMLHRNARILGTSLKIYAYRQNVMLRIIAA
jgi:hypothetical protein